MFIVVSGKQHRMREVPAYLYSGQSVVVQPVETAFSNWMVVVDTGNDDMFTANYVKDRISSGMFGTAMFPTLTAAEAYIEGSK